MAVTRQRYQFGALRRRDRVNGGPVWRFRYYEEGILREVTVGPVSQLPTEKVARKRVEALLLKINSDNPRAVVDRPTFGALLDRYIEEEKLLEIAAIQPGQTVPVGGLAFETATKYLSIIEKRLRPEWGEMAIDDVRPMKVEAWLKSLTKEPTDATADDDFPEPLSPKTKGNIKGLMFSLFERAMKWEIYPIGKNPMELVTIRGVSKRSRKPMIITVHQYQEILQRLEGPYRVLVMVAACTGIRCSELFALNWKRIDFKKRLMWITVGSCRGRLGRVKSEASEDYIPMDDDFMDELKAWREQCPQTEGDWLFPSAITQRPLTPTSAARDYLVPAGIEAGLPHNIGWHTLRHSYRAWMDEVGTPLSVQQKLMRHAQLATTMKYGDSAEGSKREANSKVVQMLRRKAATA